MLVLSLIAASIAQTFTDVSEDVGLVDEEKKSWGNPIWGDFDGDGFPDLIVPTHGLSVSKGPFVYTNDGSAFTDVRTTCGITRSPEYDSNDWHGISFGDYDGDGNLDVYVAEGGKAKAGGTDKRDLLFRGNGDGTFENVSDEAGILVTQDRGRQGSFVDYDDDGALDLFVKNFGDQNRLYHNEGDGTFADASVGSGLEDATFGADDGSISSWADFDLDGWIDVAFSGDGTSTALFRNQGDGTFEDVSIAAGLGTADGGNGIAWGDYDNDGFPDLFVTRPEGADSLWHNEGDGTFTDVASDAGIDLGDDLSTWAAAWGDYDNDGWLDLFVTNAGDDRSGVGNANLLYHNEGDGTFTDVAATEGADLKDGTSLHNGVAWADWNGDGFLDLLVKDGIGDDKDTGDGADGAHRLLENAGNRNHWIEVSLEGVASNRMGIGARVAVKAGTALLYRQQTGGGGGDNASQGAEPLHVGVGRAKRVTVQVIWPSGEVDLVRKVEVDQVLAIREGDY